MDTHSLILFIVLLGCVCALENLSLFKNASMSSREFTDKWQASAAVDNNTNQRLEGNSCAHTALRQPIVSWTVDLGRMLAFSNVTIYYRDENDGINFTFRLSGFSIFTSNDLNVPFSANCYRNNDGIQANPGPSSIFTAPCNSYGRYVSLYKDRSSVCRPLGNINTCALFELCEVQVFGCQANWYGQNCSNRCPSNCLNDICDIASGICFGCKTGYNGSSCESPCPYGTFGHNCGEVCSGNCRNNATCNTVDGTCISCSAGWQGPRCTEECEPGTYGDCKQQCGICLNNIACNRFDGTCPNGCGEGGEGKLCFPRGNFKQYNCPNNCLNTTCDSDNHCIACENGYTGTFCNVMCESGKYGRDCSQTCDSACEKGSCHHKTGECATNCVPGRKGRYCDQECGYRKYGIDCLRTCDNCLDGGCSAETGICLKGCLSGWTGPSCSSQTAHLNGNQQIAVVIVLSVGLAIVIAINVLMIIKPGLFPCRHGYDNNRNQNQNSKDTQPETHGTTEMYENPNRNYDTIIANVEDAHTYTPLQ